MSPYTLMLSRGSTISIRWLCDRLSTPAPDVDEVTLERSTRGFILTMMGSFLFTDKKGVHVHMCFLLLLRDLTHTATYSWGGLVLAHTYRELCRASLNHRPGISGCITLIHVCNIFILLHTHSYTQHIIRLLTFCLFYIQLWSWERFHVGQPNFGRPATYPAPPVAHALHDDDADANVVNGDLAEAIGRCLMGYASGQDHHYTPIWWVLWTFMIHICNGIIVLHDVL